MSRGVKRASVDGSDTDSECLGRWMAADRPAHFGVTALEKALRDLRRPVAVVSVNGRAAICTNGSGSIGTDPGDSCENSSDALPLLAYAPPMSIKHLGDANFVRDHRIGLAYVAGAMANGISSVDLVTAISEVGMLGFFGAAGLSTDRIADALDQLAHALGDRPYGSDLIHSPDQPAREQATVDLYLARRLRLVSASAFMSLTPALVRYRVTGIHRNSDGRVVAPNRVMAKVSRIEVARQFFAPPPESMVWDLVDQGHLSAEQAELARQIPVAGDLTAEADSGGHTDNRPALALLPAMLTLAARLTAQYGYAEPLRVGAAGGISTPAAAAAVFGVGAAYVMSGSVNQACVEAGTSDVVRAMLAEAEQADTAMAPAADMFELGAKVQVLKRGTMFAMRATRLHEIYRSHDSLAALSPTDRSQLEKSLFKQPLEQVWDDTRRYFAEHDPDQVERAERDPKHQMALVFRSYLGRSSQWANSGEPSRRIDYQIWCGPSMGAFNEWTRGTFLASPEHRRVGLVARNIMHSAAVLARIQTLRSQGYPVPAALLHRAPMTAAELEEVGS